MLEYDFYACLDHFIIKIAVRNAEKMSQYLHII